MYTHHSITLQVAEDRRRDMLAAAERARLARQARTVARARQPRSSRRGVWQLVWQLRPQAQS
jgi:hypothetical protein